MAVWTCGAAAAWRISICTCRTTKIPSSSPWLCHGLRHHRSALWRRPRRRRLPRETGTFSWWASLYQPERNRNDRPQLIKGNVVKWMNNKTMIFPGYFGELRSNLNVTSQVNTTPILVELTANKVVNHERSIDKLVIGMNTIMVHSRTTQRARPRSIHSSAKYTNSNKVEKVICFLFFQDSWR